MGSTGGIRHEQGSTVPNWSSGANAEAGKAAHAQQIGRGFSGKNSVSHQGAGKALQSGARDRQVRLPKPAVDPGQVASPAMLSKIAHNMDSTEMLFAVDELLNQLGGEESDIQDDGDTGTSVVYGSKTRKAGQQGQQGGDSSGQNPNGGDQAMMAGFANQLAGNADAKTLQGMQIQALDVFDKVMAIENAPPEVMAGIKEATDQLAKSMLSGNVEDMARMLMEVQTKLQDTRIKFDEQAIRTNKLKRQQLGEQRVQKLTEALAKMQEAKAAGIFGKVFSAIATALAVVVAAVTIATGVGAKAGVMLIMAATIMVAMTISQNTGDWMTNLGGLIKDDKAQLVLGLAWAVLAACLSLGSGLAASGAKAPADAATVAVQQASNATAQATQQAATAAGQAASQGATAASQAAQQGAQQAAMAAKMAAKTTAKAAADSADEVATQAAKAATKAAQKTADESAKAAADAARVSVKETVKESSKAATEATKETSKEAAKQMAEISKRTSYFRRAAHIAKFTQGASTAADGAATLTSTVKRYEGEMYQADAMEDLAHMTMMQMQMEDWMEAIQRVIQEISEGQEIASNMLSQALTNKFTMTRNI